MPGRTRWTAACRSTEPRRCARARGHRECGARGPRIPGIGRCAGVLSHRHGSPFHEGMPDEGMPARPSGRAACGPAVAGPAQASRMPTRWETTAPAPLEPAMDAAAPPDLRPRIGPDGRFAGTGRPRGLASEPAPGCRHPPGHVKAPAASAAAANPLGAAPAGTRHAPCDHATTGPFAMPQGSAASGPSLGGARAHRPIQPVKPSSS